MKSKLSAILILFTFTTVTQNAFCQAGDNFIVSDNNSLGIKLVVGFIFICLLTAFFYSWLKFKKAMRHNRQITVPTKEDLLTNPDYQEIDAYLKVKEKKCSGNCGSGSCKKTKGLAALLLFVFISDAAWAQDTADASD